jgi:hypothetical protein
MNSEDVPDCLEAMVGVRALVTLKTAAVKDKTDDSLELVIGNGCLDAAAATAEGPGDEVRVDYVTGFIGCYN